MTHLSEDRLVEELGESLHLLAVWVFLALPVATLVDRVIETTTGRLVFLSTEGLLLGTVPVLVLELLGARPSIPRAVRFFVVSALLAGVLSMPLSVLTPAVDSALAHAVAVGGAIAVDVLASRSDRRWLASIRALLARLLPPPASNR